MNLGSRHLPIAEEVGVPIAENVSRARNLVGVREVKRGWNIVRDTAYGFIEDEALSRGAAIAFYTATSIAPVLLIVIAIAGLAFGHDAAQNALIDELSGLMGEQTAQLLQTAVASAAKKSSGALATLIGLVTDRKAHV